jgi:hypothetical protein
MANRIEYTTIFEKYFKRYSKKYRSLKTEIKEIESILLENPMHGIDLGNGLYKIRIGSKSKNKGKSGGFRMITYLPIKTEDSFIIYLVIIYDKDEISDISKNKLIEIVQQIFS